MDETRRILVTNTFGTSTDREILDYFQQLIDDARCPDGMNSYVDTLGIDDPQVTPDGLERIRHLMETNEHRFAGSRWAIVADHDNVFGMTRMFELRLDPQAFEVAAFRAPAEALVWLGLDASDDLMAGRR